MATKVYLLLFWAAILHVVAANDHAAIRTCTAKTKGKLDGYVHATLKSELAEDQKEVVIPFFEPGFVGVSVTGVYLVACWDKGVSTFQAQFHYPNLIVVRTGGPKQQISLQVTVYTSPLLPETEAIDTNVFR